MLTSTHRLSKELHSMSSMKTSPATSKALPCPSCAKSFSSTGGLAQHRRVVHAIPCTFPKCTKTFQSREALEQHLDSAVHGSARLVPSQGRKVESSNGSVLPDPAQSKQTVPAVRNEVAETEHLQDSRSHAQWHNVEFVPPVVVRPAIKPARFLGKRIQPFTTSSSLGYENNTHVSRTTEQFAKLNLEKLSQTNELSRVVSADTATPSPPKYCRLQASHTLRYKRLLSCRHTARRW